MERKNIIHRKKDHFLIHFLFTKGTYCAIYQKMNFKREDFDQRKYTQNQWKDDSN